MSKTLSPAARTYLRKLKNPYAAEQLDDGVGQPVETSESAEHYRLAPQGEERERTEVWVLQDPYASLSEDVPKSERRSLRALASATCSKAAFRNGCRHIFRQYTPAPEKSSLREEHVAFITRNEDRSPERRYALLRELQRYDLSNIPGIAPQLNREKDALTEEKLKSLEHKILGE